MAEPIREIRADFGANREWPQLAPKELGEPSEIAKAMASDRQAVRALYDGTETMRVYGIGLCLKTPAALAGVIIPDFD